MYRNEYKDWSGMGARVKMNRKMLGMTTEKLAENIDRTENYVIRFEKGEKTCSIHTLYQLSKVLNGLENGYTFTNTTKVSGSYLEKYVEDNDEWTSVVYKKNIDLTKILPRTGM